MFVFTEEKIQNDVIMLLKLLTNRFTFPVEKLFVVNKVSEVQSQIEKLNKENII